MKQNLNRNRDQRRVVWFKLQQKASVGRFEVQFGLDLYRSVKELCAKKWKHSIILHLHSELNRRLACG